MEPKEFDNVVNEALADETRKIIEEQLEKTDNLIDSVKSFQSLTGLAEKIAGIESMGSEIEISIKGITPEELVKCCGGDSLGKAQTNLMQSLHHDLDDAGLEGTYDIDINTDGDENSLDLNIKLCPNDDELSKENETDMEEQTDNGELKNTFGQAMYEEPKDTNPTAKDDKDMILGDEKEVDEQWQKVAGAAVGNLVANKVSDMLSSGSQDVDEQAQEASGAMAAEEDMNEHHMKDKSSRIAFICKNDKTCKKEDLEKLSDEEIEKKYLALEKKMGMNESKKKVVTLTETEMEGLIEKIIREAEDNPHLAVPTRGVPGIDVTKKSRNDSGKENDEALKAVEKKIKDYLSFDGNDDPEFPEPVGKGEQKVATKNTDSENDVVDLNRGRTPADLTYDQEPSEQFKERAKLSLVGASEMGNSSEYANAIPSKVGDDMVKTAEKRKEARVDEPIYDKEAVPVDEDSDKKDRPGPESGNAGDAVASDILRMKQMSNYKEKTQ